jgi:hypothetical protein
VTSAGVRVDDLGVASQTLVESVSGEISHQFEDAVGVFFCVSLPDGAVHEGGFLLRHLFGFFLSHRAAQEVGAAEGVARHVAGDLHDLLLVDDDAVGVFEDGLEARMGIRDVDAAVLSLDEVLDHAGAEGAGAVEGDGGDDVLEAVGLELLEEGLHAARLELEDVRGLARAQERVGRGIVERDAVDADRVAFAIGAAVDHPHRDVDDGERAQAEEVELHEASRLDVVLVVLGDVDVGLGAEDGDVVPERAFADDDAGGVHAGVAREVLERHRRVEQVLDVGVLGVLLLEARLLCERVLDRDALALHRLGDERRDAAGVGGAHAHDASHVAYDAAALQ